MWNLKSVKARNICSFGKMQCEITQNVATLIFGENEDDGENQRHNGSGKSSFLECIGFGITGEAFRKVSTIEDIIRDDESYAEVTLEFADEKCTMTIHRRIERGETQQVSLSVRTGDDVVDEPFVTVQDMNKRILERLGVSKADLYNNYLLNNNRFQSFFDASDKDKKEIINTFSNGILVDEAIEELKKDMEAAGKEVDLASIEEGKVAGKMDAYKYQLEVAERNAEDDEVDRKRSIESHMQMIANKRGEIRNLQLDIDRYTKAGDDMDATCENLEKLLSDDGILFESKLNKCRKDLEIYGLSGSMSDWEGRAVEADRKLDQTSNEISKVKSDYDSLTLKVQSAKSKYEKIKAEFDRISAECDDKDKADRAEISEIETEIKSIESGIAEIDKQRSECIEEILNLSAKITVLSAEIKGAIQCPKCGYQFSLRNNVGVDELKAKMHDHEVAADKLCNDRDAMTERINGCNDDLKDCGLDIRDIEKAIEKRHNEVSSLGRSVTEAMHEFERLNGEAMARKDRLSILNTKLDQIRETIGKMADDMVNETIDILDRTIDKCDAKVASCKEDIAACKSSIGSLEEVVAKLESKTAADGIEAIRKSIEETAQELADAGRVVAERKSDLNLLKEQESLFVQFKTHLANTKIASIAKVTNQVLKDVKSTLRVQLSGYTVTKTKKIRDKISVSVIRDGEDRGSFLKCSAGEKARIMFANIVAMHRMTNLNSPSGGLNLICIDEVMDHCEEAGIMSVAEIANELGITVLMITQGHTSEGYPHELIVTKRLGVSTLSAK